MAFKLPSSFDLTAIRASFMELGKLVEGVAAKAKSVDDLKGDVARALGYGDALKLEVGHVRVTAEDAVRQAIEAAQLGATLQEAVDGKITTYFQAAAPAAAEEGDLWFDTDDGNQLYRLTNGTWTLAKDHGIADALSAAATAQGTADGKSTIYYQTGAPTGLTASNQGDLWVDTDDNLKVWAWTGSSWVLAQDWMTAKLRADDAWNSAQSALSAAAMAQETADGKITTYFQNDPPTGLTAGDLGDLWFDTNDGNKLYRWTGSAWSVADDTRIGAAVQAAATAQGTADGKARIYFQTGAPTGLTASDQGDLWVDTDDNMKVWAWNGSAWVLAQDWMTAKAAADSALGSIADMAADGIITDSERPTLKTMRDALASSVAAAQAKADSMSVGHAALDTAWTTFTTNVDPILNASGNWVFASHGQTKAQFDGWWSAVHSELNALLGLLAKTPYDTLGNIADDGLLTDQERPNGRAWLEGERLKWNAAYDAAVAAGEPTGAADRLTSDRLGLWRAAYRFFADHFYSLTTTGSVSISVDASAKTFTRSSGSFITDGFQVGQRIMCSPSANSGEYVITNVAATVLTCASQGPGTTETAATRIITATDAYGSVLTGAEKTGTAGIDTSAWMTMLNGLGNAPLRARQYAAERVAIGGSAGYGTTATWGSITGAAAQASPSGGWTGNADFNGRLSAKNGNQISVWNAGNSTLHSIQNTGPMAFIVNSGTTALSLDASSGAATFAGSVSMPDWTAASGVLGTTLTGGQTQIFFKEAGTIRSQITSNFGDGNLYLYHRGINALVLDSAGAATFASVVSALEFNVSNAVALRATAAGGGGGTGGTWAQFINSQGTLYVGRDSSTGASFGLANGAVIYNSGNNPLGFFTNGALRLTIAADGAATFAGTLDAAGKLGLSYNSSFASYTGTYTGYGFFIQPTSSGRVVLSSYSSGGSTELALATNPGAGQASVIRLKINATGTVTIDNSGDSQALVINSIVAGNSGISLRNTTQNWSMAVRNDLSGAWTLRNITGSLDALKIATDGVATFASRATFAGTAQFSGGGSPTSGAGIELSYASGWGTSGAGRVLAYDRTAGARKELWLDASSIQLQLDGAAFLTLASGAATFAGALTSTGSMSITGAWASLAMAGRAALGSNGTSLYFYNGGGGYALRNAADTANLFLLADSGAATFAGSVTAQASGASFTSTSNSGFIYTTARIAGSNNGTILFNNGTTYNFTISEIAGGLVALGNSNSAGAANNNAMTLHMGTGAATFAGLLTAGGTYGFTIGAATGTPRVTYGLSSSTGYGFLTGTNSYADLFAGAATFAGAVTAASVYTNALYFNTTADWVLRNSTGNDRLRMTDAGAATFAGTIRSTSTYGWQIGDGSGMGHVLYGYPTSVAFGFYSHATSYADIYAGAASFAGTISATRINIDPGNVTNSDLNLKNSVATLGLTIQEDTSGAAYIWQRENMPMYFGTNGATRLTIAASGAATFAGSVKTTGGSFGVPSGYGIGFGDPASFTEYLTGNASSHNLQFVTNNVVRLTIDSAGAASFAGKVGSCSPSTTSFEWQRTGVSAKAWGLSSDNGGTYIHNITDGVLNLYLGNGGSATFAGRIYAPDIMLSSYGVWLDSAGSVRIYGDGAGTMVCSGSASLAGTLVTGSHIAMHGVNSRFFLDTTGVPESNWIGTTGDYWLTLLCGRGNGCQLDLRNDGSAYINNSVILTIGNVGTNAATLQAAVASATAPKVGTYAQMQAWVGNIPSGTKPYWFCTDVNSDDGSYGSLWLWTPGVGWVKQTAPPVITGRVTAGVISAGAIGAQALAAEIALVSILRSFTYQAGTSTVAPVGFKFSGNAWDATLLGGETLSVVGELGENLSVGGYKVVTYKDRIGQVNRIRNGRFYRGLMDWFAEGNATYSANSSTGSSTGSACLSGVGLNYNISGSVSQSFSTPKRLPGQPVYLTFSTGYYCQGGADGGSIVVYLMNLGTGTETALATYNFSGPQALAWTSRSIDVTSYFNATGDFAIRFAMNVVNTGGVNSPLQVYVDDVNLTI